MRLRNLSILGVLPIALVSLTTAPAVSDDRAAPVSATDDTGVSRAVPRSVLEVAPGNPNTFVGPSGEQRIRPMARTASFRVTYTGFGRRARLAFQRSVDVWAQRVSSPVPITVSARFQPLQQGVLGSAGPSNVWRDFPGRPQPRTWYPDAVANKRFGSQLAASADIVAVLNSSRSDWYFGGDGNPPAGRIDFQTVVMHELGHGLGFLGAGNVSGSTGSVRQSGFPYGYDRFTENSAGAGLLGFPDNSPTLGNQLRSNGVFFDSRRVRDANGGARAKLFAPATFQPGSSYSHLDEAAFAPGTTNSLMTPFLSTGEAVHVPGPVVNAIFKGIGW